MNRFRYYYEIAEEIINGSSHSFLEEEAAPPATGDSNIPPPVTDIDPNAMDTSVINAAAASSTPTTTTPEKITGDVKNKVDSKEIIKPREDANAQFLMKIDNLIADIFEKQQKALTISNAMSFLDDINYTKPKKYDQEDIVDNYKELNTFLLSPEYANLSPTLLYPKVYALKESYKILKKDYQKKKEKDKEKDLDKINKKASILEKNLDELKDKVEKIKANLANINQIFSLQGYDKFSDEAKRQIGLVQKNSTEFIKKLS